MAPMRYTTRPLMLASFRLLPPNLRASRRMRLLHKRSLYTMSCGLSRSFMPRAKPEQTDKPDQIKPDQVRIDQACAS